MKIICYYGVSSRAKIYTSSLSLYPYFSFFSIARELIPCECFFQYFSFNGKQKVKILLSTDLPYRNLAQLSTKLHGRSCLFRYDDSIRKEEFITSITLSINLNHQKIGRYVGNLLFYYKCVPTLPPVRIPNSTIYSTWWSIAVSYDKRSVEQFSLAWGKLLLSIVESNFSQ